MLLTSFIFCKLNHYSFNKINITYRKNLALIIYKTNYKYILQNRKIPYYKILIQLCSPSSCIFVLQYSYKFFLMFEPTFTSLEMFTIWPVLTWFVLANQCLLILYLVSPVKCCWGLINFSGCYRISDCREP